MRVVLPAHSLIPLALALLMGWLGLEALTALRYTHCTPWAAFRPPPQPAVRLLSSTSDALYIEARDGNVYRYWRNAWHRSTRPTNAERIWRPRQWVKWFFNAVPDAPPSSDLSRVAYQSGTYVLVGGGKLWGCSAEGEGEHLLRSPAIIVLVVPMIGMIISGICWLKIYAEEAEVVLRRDYWTGRIYYLRRKR